MLFGKYVNRFYKKYFWNFFIGIVFLILIDIVQLYVPELISSLSTMYDEGVLTMDKINETASYIFLVAIFMLTGRFIWRVCILSGAFNITADLRADMFSKNERLSQRYYQENKVGGIMAYYTNDLDTIQEAFGWGTVMLVDAVFLSGLSFYKMMMVNWQLGLICLIPLVLLCFMAYFIDKKMKEIYFKRQKSFERMSDFSQEMFTGLRVVKAFVREKKEALRFKSVNNDNKNKDLSLIRFSTLLDTLFHVLTEGMIVIGLAVGGYFVFQTVMGYFDYNFTRADVIEFNGYFNSIIWPMIALGQIVSLISRAKTSLRRITTLLDEKEDIVEKENPEIINNPEGKITFKNFNYQYPESDNGLKNINLEINKGEMIGVVGRIGSSKSTLVSTLLRLHNFKKGTLFIDDVDIMDMSIKQLRDIVSFVPQDNFLFSSNVRENIVFNDQELSEEEIIEAAEFADVHDNIKEFIDGYLTLVGERGVTLSGGQKQRIAIARAYIRKTPIMVLDDSVSAVDVKTEEKILNNIKEKRKGLTTIIVASRVSTVSNLDRIIVMNDMEVEAFGTHQELMECSKTYQTMVELQKLKNELEGGEY